MIKILIAKTKIPKRLYIAAASAALFWLCLFIPRAHGANELSNLSNFSLSTWPGSGDMSDNYNLCVKMDSGTDYQISASTGDGSVFKLKNGGNYIEFNVYWNDQVGSSGQQQMTAGTVDGSIGTQSGASNVSGCGGIMNANIEIKVPSSNLSSAVAGAYSSTLTLSLSAPP